MSANPAVREPALSYGDLADHARPLAVLVHGFPDTPHTWRHLGPALADQGYRVVAPWLPGYRTAVAGPIGVGTYVRHVLDVRDAHGGDERSVLVGHDWGANCGYGVAALRPDAFSRFVALAVPPTPAMGPELFEYAQVRRSFYVWLIQQVGLAETVLLTPGFWESLWADWSPGYDCADDVAMLRDHVTESTIGSVLAPYRASFDPSHADESTAAEALASMSAPPIPVYYLHGADDGAIGADVVARAADHLTAPGSRFDVVDGVGHFLHLECPGLLAERIIGWLAG